MSNITQDIYITGAEAGSGKSVIVLAMMEMVAGQAQNIGFFRPVIRESAPPDLLIQLVRERYQLKWSYESMYGCTEVEARAILRDGGYDELLKVLLTKYRALKSQCDHVVCVGSDYRGGDSIYEFDFNADVANNLNCLLMPIVHGVRRDIAEILDAYASLRHGVLEHNAEALAIVINGVPAQRVAGLRLELQQRRPPGFPVYVVPADPSLEMPSIADIARSLQADVLSENGASMNREVHNYKIAAMLAPDFLDHLEAGDLIITPGDRSDIILACLMAFPSTNYPKIAGLLLTGQAPAPQLSALIEGLDAPPFSILSVQQDTWTTAQNVSRVHAHLHAENERRIATALALVEDNIAMPELRQRLKSPKSPRRTPLMFEYDILHKARSDPRHIVLPEGEEERILRAAEILRARGIVRLTLLGNVDKIRQRIQQWSLQLEGVEIVDPVESPLRRVFAEEYARLRRHKGVVLNMAYDLMADVSYFGTLMVHLGYADGLVSGAVHTTAHTIRPAFQVVKTRPGSKLISSVFFMALEDRVLVYGDCAVNPDPDAAQLAEIAISAADTAKMFNIEPLVAMLSYSTGDSGSGRAVDKVREATRLAQQARPDLILEGPMQYDAAVDRSVAATKLPGSRVAGRASVLIFPDLNTGNNTYKAVQRSSGAVAIGPILQGLNKPVNDLSRGCTVTDIVNTVAITAIQAQGKPA